MIFNEIRRVITCRDDNWKQFLWFPKIGIGWFPVKEYGIYDENYFKKYESYRDTKMGDEIVNLRKNIVLDHTDLNDEIIDIGIGSGHFLEEIKKSRPRSYGFDVNLTGVDWLQARGLYKSPYTLKSKEMVDAITCWDSLEHIRYFDLLLEKISKLVFVSTPIYSGPDHVLKSKHFRPREHYWYFTHSGLIHCFDELGFELIHHDQNETTLGREDIGSYVFRRLVK